jgi:hypothetical protein
VFFTLFLRSFILLHELECVVGASVVGGGAKSDQRCARGFAVLQYTRQHGLVRERRVCVTSLGASEAGSAENLPRLFTMFFKGVAEEGSEFVAPLSFVLVGLPGFHRRGARRGARRVSAVRWIRVSLLGTPKLASTYGLDVRKGEVLVVVQVVEDQVVRGAKGAVGGGFEGSENDGPKYVVDGERAHVLESAQRKCVRVRGERVPSWPT